MVNGFSNPNGYGPLRNVLRSKFLQLNKSISLKSTGAAGKVSYTSIL